MSRFTCVSPPPGSRTATTHSSLLAPEERSSPPPPALSASCKTKQTQWSENFSSSSFFSLLFFKKKHVLRFSIGFAISSLNQAKDSSHSTEKQNETNPNQKKKKPLVKPSGPCAHECRGPLSRRGLGSPENSCDQKNKIF